jgi:hypothetical protein
MPEISRFFGIIIRMFNDDHGLPHFHAFYQNFGASVEVESGIVRGDLPPRILGFVQEWRALHKQELLACWHEGIASKKFPKVEPLE